MTRSYDLIVIGAGMAGVAAANKCASAGWRVAIVDALPYGGTCALRGCDPKKILRRGAEIIDSARLMRGKGIDDAGLSMNWADLIKHKHGFTDPVPRNMEDSLSGNGVDTLHGQARFTNAHTIAIDGRSYDAAHFLIAAGARPRPLDFPGHEHLVDSTAFILDRGPRPLKAFDPDLVELLINRGAEAGIELWRSTTITSIEKSGGGYQVSLARSGRPEDVEFDLIVHGAGRIPELSGLDLDAAGVEWDEQGVRVAAHLQSTSNAAVYAAGDAAYTPGMPLTPVAVIEAKVAASNMLKATTTVPDYTGIPTAVFTIPELTRVGMLEQQARDQGIDVDVRYRDTSGWYSNYRIGETTAATKILIDRSTDRIVGAHLLGPEYGELVNFFGLAMKLELTTHQLKSMTAAYPTVGSDVGSIL